MKGVDRGFITDLSVRSHSGDYTEVCAVFGTN